MVTFFQFIYLQVLDFLSTVAFLLTGIQEANPLVRWAIQGTGSTGCGLLLVKGLALGLGIFCLATKRMTLLSRVNVVYAAVVAWNLIGIILGLTLK